MVRFVLILLVSILLITVIRSVFGMIMRGVADLLRGSSQPASQRRPDVPVAGELKKDPVCGTYVSTATAHKLAEGGNTVYFCSAECKNRYTA